MFWRFARRWTIWKWESGKGNKPTKAPYQGRQPNWHASNNDFRTWSTFAEALAAAPFGGGLNFSFGGGSSRFGFVGLDLDECRNPNTGEITPWARKLVDEYGAYTEISVSGTGLHILGRKDGIEPFIKLVKMEGGGKLEIFCQANHFLCLTGNIFEGRGAVPGNLDALLAIHKPKSPPKRDPNRLRQPHGECPAWVLSAIYETPEGKRSEKFYNIVAHLKRNDWDLDDIEELFEQHLGEGPLLVKYEKRLRKEIERVFDKVPEGEELDLSWASLEDARSAPQPEPEAKTTNEGAAAGAEGGFEWPDPRRIGDGLLPVPAFEPDFIPGAIQSWCLDVADRMQCPIEYVAIPAIIALGATLGRKIAVRPKQFDNWTCVTNFWGMVIGPPGVLKSPAMEEVLKPMRRLEAEARRNFAAEMELYKAALERWEDEKTEARKNDRPTPEKPVEPTAKRYLSSDTTYEKLGVILGENPNGILVFRDELISLLLDLDKEEKCNARSFFMSAWNGDSGYTFDRIIRGTCHIEHACVSLMGAATPSRISRYIANVEKTGMGGDGLIQRFGFMIWPDIRPEWTNVDKAPNRDAREAAFAAFDRLDKIAMNDVGAELEPYDDTPFLRFSPDADRLFVQWREPLEMQLRAGGSTPMLDAHFSKYRKLVPALALVNHLSNPRGGGPIPEAVLHSALRFAGYLASHARRIYASGEAGDTAEAARAILEKIRKGDLLDGFKLREIQAILAFMPFAVTWCHPTENLTFVGLRRGICLVSPPAVS